MGERTARDPTTWKVASSDEIKAMFAEATPDQSQALYEWLKANWIVEPGRSPGSERFRDPEVPSSQIALMPGIDSFRRGTLGTSSLSALRQQVLLAAAEMSALWDLHLGTREEISEAIEWAAAKGWVAIAAEHGEAGRRSGRWAELSPEQAIPALRDPENWSAGPYPAKGSFTEVFILLTAAGREAVAAGVADDAIRAIFG